MSQSIPACLLDCQNAVKDKKYDVALGALRTALQVAQKDSKADYVNIFDHRVAVYLQMESLDLALKDAKDMIRRDRKDGRGYLRCGQIERLLGNQAAAINWYKQGLKRVPSTHRSFQSLQKQLGKVESQVREGLLFTKASDPMLALPLETVVLILSFLTYREIIGMIRVSRSWNKLLCSLSPLTDTIDYRASKRAINLSMFRATLRKLRVPKFITTTDMTNEAGALLLERLQLGRSFTELSHMELRLQKNQFPQVGLPFSNYNLKSLILTGMDRACPTGVTMMHIARILEVCPRLEVLSVHGLQRGGSLSVEPLHYPALRRLILHSQDPGITCSIWAPTLTSMPNLREISLRGIFLLPDQPEAGDEITDLRKMERLEVLHFSLFCRAPNRIYLPTTLQDLRTNSLKIRASTENTGPLEEPLTRLTNLRSLHLMLTDWPEWLEPGLMPTEDETHLSQLRLSVGRSLEPQALRLLKSGCVQRLSLLELRCQSLNDDHLTMFIDHMPQIETLILRAAAITGVFIMDLILAPQSALKEVVLQDCLSVSRDIIPWALGYHVNISIERTADSRPGRRVREAH